MSEPPPADEPASDYFDSIDDPDISTPSFAVDQAPHSPSSELRDQGSEGRDAAGDDAAPAWVSRHPLLTDAGWSDLSAFAPEITDSITTLMEFSNGLRSFEKPMVPTRPCSSSTESKRSHGSRNTSRRWLSPSTNA